MLQPITLVFSTPPWLFYTFFKLLKWYQIVHYITYFAVPFSYSHIQRVKTFSPIRAYLNCVKIVQMRSFFWSVFYLGWLRNLRRFPVFSRNTGKYVPEKTPYLDSFHAVLSDRRYFLKKQLLLNVLNPISQICSI